MTRSTFLRALLLAPFVPLAKALPKPDPVISSPKHRIIRNWYQTEYRGNSLTTFRFHQLTPADIGRMAEEENELMHRLEAECMARD